MTFPADPTPPDHPGGRSQGTTPGHNQSAREDLGPSVPTIPVASDAGVHLGTLWMMKPGWMVPVRVRADTSVVFERVGEEAVGELVQAMELEGSEEVLRRFAGGRQCYVGRVEGRVATFGWVTCAVTPSGEEEGIGELGLSIRLREGEAYIWGCETLPAYRGRRLYPALLAYIVDELWAAGPRVVARPTGMTCGPRKGGDPTRSGGVSRVWIGADADNLASQKGFVLVGFQPIADMVLMEAHEGVQEGATRRMWIRGCPGADEWAVEEARWALLGDAE